MSVITGDAVPFVRDMGESEVVSECMKVLRQLFKEQVSQLAPGLRPASLLPETRLLFGVRWSQRA